MHKKLLFILLITLTSLLSCTYLSDNATGTKDEPGITGYVVDQSDNRILVASDQAQDLSESGGVSEYYEMIWFLNAPTDIQCGDKVDIWYDTIDDSYPAKSTLQDYHIHDQEPPEEAHLTSADALKEALSKQSNHPSQIFAVRDIIFNKDHLQWTVYLFEIWSGEVVAIEVEE
ncbi:DUF3221 domain-containing protein [Amphibacillus cookii]|uniref:DUF3221 domain-containing protein n=1 Tax=Amphibacillus cookii TaxID=767787 RepID=UPI001959A54E|nr:DUF3221 domain-containing protein [Amphibacillus cookii]MBM7542080.1 hypothetical protein [Amphibacillus cookii]